MVNAIDLSFPITEIIRHEAALIGLELPGLHLGAQVYGMASLLLGMAEEGDEIEVVPGVTAAMDYLFLGNAMSGLSLAGMAAILLGLVLVFRRG